MIRFYYLYLRALIIIKSQILFTPFLLPRLILIAEPGFFEIAGSQITL